MERSYWLVTLSGWYKIWYTTCQFPLSVFLRIAPKQVKVHQGTAAHPGFLGEMRTADYLSIRPSLMLHFTGAEWDLRSLLTEKNGWKVFMYGQTCRTCISVMFWCWALCKAPAPGGQAEQRGVSARTGCSPPASPACYQGLCSHNNKIERCQLP